MRVPYEKPYCESHYLYPDSPFITCDAFGHSDGMSGGCWNCRDMTLYQWYMCQDESHLNILKMSREDGIKFINEYKMRLHRSSEKDINGGIF